MNDFESTKPVLSQVQLRVFIFGLAGMAICAAGAFYNAEQFFQSYLLGYVFWIGIALGSLALLALHHLVGGGWGFSIQRVLEAGTRTLPLFVLLFLPLLFNMPKLYIWAQPEKVAMDTVLQHKSVYLNVPFFGVRTGIYFVIWGILIYLLNKWSLALDRAKNAPLLSRIQKISGPAILLYVLTVTFSSIDWVMSLDPHWFSTIFGFVFVIGQALLTLAFAIIWTGKLAKFSPLAEVIQKKHFHDLGNLLLAFVMLWAYISLSQFLIIWSGNLPEEIPWYLHRLHGGWQWLAFAVVIFHFTLPFVVLLSRRSKRRVEILTRVAYLIIIMRLLDLFWFVAPNFHAENIRVHWLNILVPLAMGGVWLAFFIQQLKTRALLPLHDPRMKEAFHHE